MKTLLATYSLAFIALVITASGCGKATAKTSTPVDTAPSTDVPSIVVAAAAPSVSLPIPTPTATLPPGLPTFSLTTYSQTAIVASITKSGVPYTLYGTGTCVEYMSKTYCWDDGVKVFGAAVLNIVGGFSYWGLDSGVVTCPNFSAYCVGDIMSSPTTMSVNVVAHLDTVAAGAHRSYGNVLSVGTPTVNTCTESSGIVNCGSFSINTYQTSL